MWPFKARRGAVLTFFFLASSLSFSSETVEHQRSDDVSVTETPNQFSDSSCSCVPYYNCNTDNIIITNGENLIGVRQSENGDSKVEESLRAPVEITQSKHCSTTVNNAVITNRCIPKSSGDEDEESTCKSYLEVCCRLPETQVRTRNCGLRGSRIRQPYIPRLDKEQAENGEFPWMVTVFRSKIVEQTNETVNTKVYLCQGTLIHERVVLTAAQCVWRSRTGSLSIRAGQTDTMTTQEESSYQVRDVKEFKIHPKFKAGNLRNNIALLILETPVTINSNVGIGCLADHRDVMDEKNCLTIGWDKYLAPEDVYFQKSQSNDLKKRIEPFMSDENCTKSLNQTFLGKNYKLHKSFVCARGSTSKNFCSREIGTPLACPLKSNPNQYVQIGIYSWCISFGNFPTPSVFANILHARRWIDTAMAKSRIGSPANQARNLQID